MVTLDLPRRTLPLRPAGDVVFVDGTPGSGKSLLAPLVSSLEGVETWRVSEAIEVVVARQALGEISRDVARDILETIILADSLNSSLGRHVNLRLRDETGLLRNPRPLQTVLRLLLSPRKSIGPSADDHALVYATHDIAPNRMLLQQLRVRSRFIRVTRRPLETLLHHAHFLTRVEPARDFTTRLVSDGISVPWQAVEMDEDLLNECKDAVSLAASLITASAIRCTAESKADEILVIPFDAIIVSTGGVLDRIADFTGRVRTDSSNRMARSLGIPLRSVPFAGVSGSERYGWRRNLEESDALSLLDAIPSRKVREAFLEADSLWKSVFRASASPLTLS